MFQRREDNPLNAIPNKGIVSNAHASTSTHQRVEAKANAPSVIIAKIERLYIDIDNFTWSQK